MLTSVHASHCILPDPVNLELLTWS